MKRNYSNVPYPVSKNKNLMSFINIIILVIMSAIVIQIGGSSNKITQNEFIYNDKSIYLENLPIDEYQNIVAINFISEINEDWDKLNKIYDYSMKDKVDNLKKNFENGDYVKKYIIHNIITLKEDEYMRQYDTNNEANIIYQPNINEIVNKYSLVDFAVVHTNYTQNYFSNSSNKSSSGTFYTNYIVGKSNSDKNLKIYYQGNIYIQ